MTDQPSTVHLRSSSFEEAVSNCERLLDSDPAAALKQAEALVRVKQDPRVFRLAALACRKLGFEADAQGAELGGIQASLDEPTMKEAAIAQAEGRSEDALRIAERRLETEPDHLLATTIAAEALIELLELDRAEAMLRSVLERAPTFLRGSMLLAACLTKQVR